MLKKHFEWGLFWGIVRGETWGTWGLMDSD